MHSLSFSELKIYVQWLKGELFEAQLQDVWTNGEILVLEFYRSHELYWCLSTKQPAPVMALLRDRPPVEKVKKPVSLFLNSHAKNLRVDDLELIEEKGRVVRMSLSSAKKDCTLEIQLIPKNFNLQVFAGDKKISWNQVRELPPAVDITMKVEDRDWWEYGASLFSAGTAPQGNPNQTLPKDPRLKDIEKKKKALDTIRQSLSSEEASQWQALGESLKLSSVVPVEFKKLYDPKKSKSWNMENAFNKKKSLEKKREGTVQRAQILENEIAKLERDLQEKPQWGGTHEKKKLEVSSANKLLNKADSKGRKKQFNDGIEAVIGKSAQENLTILRHAQGWDLWLHLKDFPGAHAIITRPRNKNVPLETIREVSEWLIQQSFSGKKMNIGVKYEVVVVECRYVRPIKGDKLGRVNYQNPQVYSFAARTL